MAFDKETLLLVVSKPSPNQLFAGYGILKVSFDSLYVYQIAILASYNEVVPCLCVLQMSCLSILLPNNFQGRYLPTSSSMHSICIKITTLGRPLNFSFHLKINILPALM